MRRSLALIALVAIPLTACSGGTTSPTAQTDAQSATSSAANSVTSGSVSAPMPEPSESMMPQPESAMTADESIVPTQGAITTPTAGPAESTIAGILIKTAESDFGQILFDDSGQAIYLFDKERTAVADCYDECAAAWPPVLTVGAPVAGSGAVADLLGTTSRAEGSTQVTYAGHPLYYYAHEGKNEVTCHNVSEFGGLWLVVTPSGQAAG